MTIIKGVFTDFNGVPLAGKLTFSLIPDGRFNAFVRTFAIAADGIVNVDVPESQSRDAPYKISFEPTELASTVTEFVAIIPKTRSIELWDLVPIQAGDLRSRDQGDICSIQT